jgi:hypothetical protein
MFYQMFKALIVLSLLFMAPISKAGIDPERTMFLDGVVSGGSLRPLSDRVNFFLSEAVGKSRNTHKLTRRRSSKWVNVH